jgi:hypothetical protein
MIKTQSVCFGFTLISKYETEKPAGKITLMQIFLPLIFLCNIHIRYTQCGKCELLRSLNTQPMSAFLRYNAFFFSPSVVSIVFF